MNKTTINENSFDFILISIQNSIANSELNKCLVDEDDQTANFTQCWRQILNYLIDSNQTNAYLKFFHSFIDSFHSRTICSSKTLICLSILLWKQLKSISTQNDLSPRKINNYVSIIMNQICDSIKRDKLIRLNLNSTLNVKSRHFFNSKDYTSVKAILNGVCRNETTISNLIWNLLEEHMNSNIDFSYDNVIIQTSNAKSQILIDSNESITIKTFNYAIAHGLLIHLDSNNYNILKELKTLSILNSIIVDGSLVCDYQFLGFNKNLNYSQFYSLENNQLNNQIVWQNELKNILIQNNIKVVFIRGKIDKDLSHFCSINSILIFSNLTNDLFKHIVNIYNCVPITYLEHLSLNNIFKIELNIVNFLNEFYLNLKNTNLFTVVIQTRLKSTLKLYKEKLNHCLKRVHNIVLNSQYLNGNGEIEKFILNQLDQLKKSKYENDELIYFNIAKECLSNVFEIFYSIITSNKSSNETYDDFESKIESWKSACLINKYLLNIDLAIQI